MALIPVPHPGTASADFISLFLEYTDGALSPPLFRQWSGIALLAGALERRVWAHTGDRLTFPNLYTMLVAPPAIGKFVIEEVRELWADVGALDGVRKFNVAPDSVTRASLIDCLFKAKKTIMPKGARGPLEYHSLLVAAEEAGVLLPAYDLEFIGVLNSIYNNKETPYVETRRHGKPPEISIPRAQLNLLIGAQPGWLSSTFPEEAWSTGFTSRLLMIYASDRPKKPLFAQSPDKSGLRKELLRRLGLLAELYGPMAWSQDSMDFLQQWDFDGGPPTPTHSKLTHYVHRRTLHMVKLTILAAISRGAGDYKIELRDVKRALAWLVEAESVMPDIFRAMVGKSDVTIIEELHLFVVAQWNRGGRKPLPERLIYSFLSARVPSDKVTKIVEMAERSGYIERPAYGDPHFLPRAKPVQGVE